MAQLHPILAMMVPKGQSRATRGSIPAGLAVGQEGTCPPPKKRMLTPMSMSMELQNGLGMLGTLEPMCFGRSILSPLTSKYPSQCLSLGQWIS